MGNAVDREVSEDSGIEDGEPVYDTLARDIVYRKCSSSEVAKPVRRSASLRNSRNCGAERPVLRKRNSIKRSNSRNSAKENLYRISQMKVQVDGKVAVLIPRKSAVKRKRMSTIKAKLNFSRKSAKTSGEVECKGNKKEQVSSGTHEDAKKGSDKTSAISRSPRKERSENIYTDVVPLGIIKRNCGKLSQKLGTSGEKNNFKSKSVMGKINNNSWHEMNNNNMNINRTGNMALNMEKARLRKLASTGSSSRQTNMVTYVEDVRSCKMLASSDSQLARDLEKARLQRYASAESVKELSKRLTRLSVVSSVGDTF